MLTVGGSAAIGAFRDLDEARWRTAFDAKFWAYVRIMQAALPHVRRSITLVTGAAARAPMPGLVGLAATNGALEAMIATLSRELSPKVSFPILSDEGGKVADAFGIRFELPDYLGTLNGMLSQFREADVRVYAISADPAGRAESEATEEGWRFPVGHDLSVEDKRTLGLFVSTPKSPEETDRDFAEPASFIINAKGETFMVEVSNSALARPELGILLEGLKFVREQDYPIRGLA